jgi:signal transduction histidine kinase/CheY-like chemotaxis protein
MGGKIAMSRNLSLLSASEASAYEKLPVPMCIFHTHKGLWKMILVSDGFCRLLSRSREEFPEDPVDCVLPEDRERARGSWEFSAIYPGEESKSTYRLLKAPRTSLRVSCRATSRRREDGSSLLFIFYTELGEEPGAERSAEDSARVPDLGRAPDNGTQMGKNSGNYRIAKWHADLTHNKTLEYISSAERAFQLCQEDTYDESAQKLASMPSFPEDRERLADILDRRHLIQRYQDGDTSYSLEYRRDEDGEMPYWVTTIVTVFQSPSGGGLECYLSTYDITEQILEKQILSRLTMLGYEVVGLLYVHTGKCRFFRIKKLHLGMDFEQYEDYQASIDESLESVISANDRGAVRSSLLIKTIQERLKEAAIYPYSYSMTTSDGRRLQKLLQFSYLDDRKDTIFLCKSDITTQYRDEHEQIKKLHAAKLEADRANEAKSSFLSSMSHDLRTPLNGIIGFTNLAIHEKDPEKKQTYLMNVQSSGELLLDLVNDTLELSRIESGKFTMTMEAVSIRDMAEVVVTSLGPSAEIKGLKIIREPSEYPQVFVWTDKLKFQKVFLNLLSNAIKYTQSGGTITASVQMLEPAADGCNCRITVQDTGVGISPEFLPHIFDAFSQEHRAETVNILGTGLGLAIVKKIVDLMGGRISVKSDLGKGSTFCVELPLKMAEEIHAQERESAWQSGILSGKRVLLCEDNYLNTEIAKILLEEQGVQVSCAENGKTGVELFKKSGIGFYSAVLMDIRMPVMDGYDATRTIRGLNRPDATLVPIIAMTADAFEEDIRNCREAGMVGHVTKPIDSKKLLKLLRETIAAYKTP